MTINGARERNICFTTYRYMIAMASLNRMCGLCRASLLNGDWAFRISGLLDVVVELEAKIQHYMCPKCKRWLVSLENAVEDLVNFCELAKQCQSTLKLWCGPLKHTKESSSNVGVSPDIIKARPPVKRCSSTCRSLNFGQRMYSTPYEI